MNRFEIVGTSGVGKSFLYKELSKTPVTERNWFTLKEAYSFIALSATPGRLSNIILSYLLKSGITFGKDLGMSKTILDQEIKENYEYLDDFKNIIDYHMYYLQNQNELSVISKIQYFNILIKKLNEIDFLKKNILKHVCIDEGPVHKIFLDKNMLESFGKLSAQDPFFKNLKLIYLEKDPKLIFEQILERRRKGINNFSYRNLDNQQLRRKVEEHFYLYRNRIRILEEYNIEILYIDACENLNRNLGRVNGFINSTV